MKVLHVVDSMDPKKGGISRAIQTMAIESAKMGVVTEVVSLDVYQLPLFNSLFTIHTLGPSKTPWSYSSKLIPWFLENISRFDTIIVHGLWLYHSYAVTAALKRVKNLWYKKSKLKIPKLFIMPHGMLDPYFQRSSERKIKAVRNWAYWKLIEGQVVNSADAILFTCKEECRLANEPFKPYHPKHEFIVGLGIEPPPAFNDLMLKDFRTKCPLTNSPYILFLGRIDAKKGVDHLIQAYEKVVSDMISNPCTSVGNNSYNFRNGIPKLVIAGPGLETPYGQKILSMVKNNPFLSKSVCFPGMLVGNAKWGAFYGCEAFALPSHQENFGIAVVEALACCKPVLISKQVNICHEIKSFKGGLIEEDSLEGTYNNLKSWFKMSDQDRKAMGLNGRRCFETHFEAVPATERLIQTINAF
jgi:glycosyltransferase involved in cell wall biosynthesis